MLEKLPTPPPMPLLLIMGVRLLRLMTYSATAPMTHTPSRVPMTAPAMAPPEVGAAPLEPVLPYEMPPALDGEPVDAPTDALGKDMAVDTELTAAVSRDEVNADVVREAAVCDATVETGTDDEPVTATPNTTATAAEGLLAAGQLTSEEDMEGNVDDCSRRSGGVAVFTPAVDDSRSCTPVSKLTMPRIWTLVKGTDACRANCFRRPARMLVLFCSVVSRLLVKEPALEPFSEMVKTTWTTLTG